MRVRAGSPEVWGDLGAREPTCWSDALRRRLPSAPETLVPGALVLGVLLLVSAGIACGPRGRGGDGSEAMHSGAGDTARIERATRRARRSPGQAARRLRASTGRRAAARVRRRASTGRPTGPRVRRRAPNRHAPAPLVVRHFAAGHADAALFWTAAGQAMLVDAGRGNAWLLGDDLVERRLLPHLRARGIGHLNVFVVTHPHPDHIGNLSLLPAHVDIQRIFTNQDALPTLSGAFRLLGRAGAIRLWKRGDRLRLGRLQVTVLAPGSESAYAHPGASQSARENNRSLVLRVQFGKVRFLLMGDVMAQGERLLLNLNHKADLRAQVLKVGHHGLGSTGDRLLDVVRPRYAVISCGRTLGRRRSLPNVSLLRRLARRRVTLLRTDRDGDVVFTTDGERLQVRTEQQHRLSRERLPR